MTGLDKRMDCKNGIATLLTMSHCALHTVAKMHVCRFAHPGEPQGVAFLQRDQSVKVQQ